MSRDPEDLVERVLSPEEQKEQIEEESKQPDIFHDVVMARNMNFGAPSSVSLGRVGSAKTALQCRQADLLLNEGMKAEGEKIWWYGREACEWQRMEVENCKIFVDADEVVEFKEGDVNTGEVWDPDLEYHAFNDFEELYEMGEEDKLNVVYQPVYEWPVFIQWMSNNVWGWNSIIMDEIEDLAPENAAGKGHKANKAAGDIIKDMRKNRIALYANTQAYSDLSYMVKSKIMVWALHPGAAKPKNCPVFKQAIRSLSIGEAWLWTGGQFQRISYPKYTTGNPKIRAKLKTWDIQSIEKYKEIVEEIRDARKSKLRKKYNISEDKILNLWEEGLTDTEIAEELGIPRQTVSAKLRKHNKESNHRVDVEKIIDLWEDGLNDSEIASELDISQQTVSAKLRENGKESNYKKKTKKVSAHYGGEKVDED